MYSVFEPFEAGLQHRVTSPHPLDCRYVSAERHNIRSQPRWAEALLLSKLTKIRNSFIEGKHTAECRLSGQRSAVCFHPKNSFGSCVKYHEPSWLLPCRQVKSLGPIPLMSPQRSMLNERVGQTTLCYLNILNDFLRSCISQCGA